METATIENLPNNKCAIFFIFILFTFQIILIYVLFFSSVFFAPFRLF